MDNGNLFQFTANHAKGAWIQVNDSVLLFGVDGGRFVSTGTKSGIFHFQPAQNPATKSMMMIFNSQ